MGNQITPQNFIQNQWELIEKNITHSVWRNRTNLHLHIEGHDRFSTDQYTYHTDKDIFQLRHNNPYLVAGMYLQEHAQHQFCSNNYKYRIFIEKIPIRLTDIEHIPYPDIIHLYNQCLYGFEVLTQKIGYFFEVEQSYIGINERGVVKVWLSKYFANSSTIGNKITQEQMVKGIIDIIDKNSDPYVQNITNIKNYLYRNSDGLSFAGAKRQLQSYITTYNKRMIPSRLDCVQQAGGVYAIANRPQIYHRQQSTVGEQPFHLQLVPSSSKLQQVNHPNQAQRVSNTDLSQLDSTTRNLAQNRDHKYLASAAFIPSQINVKGNETFVSPPQQKIVVQTRPRINKEVRRTKSDFESLNFLQPIQSPQNIKHIQTIQQLLPADNRQLNLNSNSNNVAISRPVQFSSPAANRKIPPNLANRHVNQTGHQPINQNTQQPSLPISAIPSLQMARNSSTKNLSTSSFLANSFQANTPTSTYPPNQARTVNQNSNLAKDFINEKSTFKTAQNDSNKRISPQKQKIHSTYPLTSKEPLVEQKKRQATSLLSVTQQRGQLLASFNPSYTQQNSTFEIQKPQEKHYIPEKKTYQSDEKFKRTSQINPDDGKSSEQFLRKLHQIKSSIGTPQYQRNKPSLATDNRTNTYNNYIFSKNQKEQPKKQIYSQIGLKTPVETFAYSVQEQFGKNAVSKIFQISEPSYRNINAFGNNEPLKFQKGLTMKYSRLQVDQPEPFQFRKQNTFGMKYESKIDSDLLADLNRLSR